MSNSGDIHQSIIDSEDIEEIHEDEIPVSEVIVSLGRHPFQVISRWNWKSATMGALLRSFFYLAVYRASKESWVVTLTAMLVEFGFRFLTSGIAGALVQSFRRAKPVWLATLIVTVSLPFLSHLVEYFTHYYQEAYFSNVFPASQNDGRQKAFAISVMFSVISALFNIYVMRNGVLLVGAGEETNSFFEDMKQIPVLIFFFITYLPFKMIDFYRSGNLLSAIGIFLGFGLTVGTVLGFFRGHWTWAWRTALGAWVIMFIWTTIVTLFMRDIRRSP